MAVETAERPTRGALPPVTVARFEEALSLVERLVEENADIFLQAGQRHAERHRAATSRGLSAEESAQVASAMAAAVDRQPTAADAARVQRSSLRAYEHPDPREVLLAAGLATAPAFMRVVRQFTALVEMPRDVFEDALEDDRLPHAIDQAAEALRDLPVLEARQRATAALEHYAAAAGYDPGKGWALLIDAVRQPLMDAISSLTPTSASRSASLIDSAASTAAGPDATSSP